MKTKIWVGVAVGVVVIDIDTLFCVGGGTHGHWDVEQNILNGLVGMRTPEKSGIKAFMAPIAGV